MDDAYLGEIRLFAGPKTPSQWLVCDGSLLSTSEFSTLYSLLGNTYGGDANKFALPDLRGRVPVGIGKAASGTGYGIGQAGGAEKVPLNAATMPAHTHSFMLSNASAAGNSLVGKYFGNLAATDNLYVAPSASGLQKEKMSSDALQTAGATTPHDNIMPTCALNYIICTNGFYPAPQGTEASPDTDGEDA